MKKVLPTFILILFICPLFSQDPNITQLINSVSADSLKKYTYTLASDEFAGRLANTPMDIKVSNCISSYFKQNGLMPVNHDSYFQKFPPLYNSKHQESLNIELGVFPKKIDFKTQNVIGIIRGSDPNLGHIVVSSHHDHLGRYKDGKQIFHGADDNGSGTAALIEMSRVAKIASIKGFKPKRTIVFISFDSEEFGLIGSDFYVNNPILPLDKVLCNVNLDMIGRIDSVHVGNKKQNDKYIYCIYKDSTKKVITKDYLNSINSSYTHLILDNYYDQASDNSRWANIIPRSDHYSFLKKGVPVVWLFSGLHKDYHKPTDTADKINYPLFSKRVQFALALIYDLAKI